MQSSNACTATEVDDRTAVPEVALILAAGRGSRLSSRSTIPKPLTKVLDLEKWKLRDIADFTPKKQKLLAAIIRAKGDPREAARLDLARFYFANGFGTEVLAVLRRIEIDRAEIEDDPEFRMLRGGARYMMGRFAAAAEDLSHESLKDNDEAILWNAAVRAPPRHLFDERRLPRSHAVGRGYWKHRRGGDLEVDARAAS